MIFGNTSQKTRVHPALIWAICLSALAAPNAATAQTLTPLPELIYYSFDEVGTTVTNKATPATRVNASGTLVGDISQNGIVGRYGSGMVGSGGSARTDHMNTGWTTNLSGSWTISLCLHDIPSAEGPFFLFGDKTAQRFRCTANGGNTSNVITLRATNIADVVVPGALVPGEPTVTHFVYDSVAGEIRAYVNGVLKTTVAQVLGPIVLSGTGTLKIGGHSSDLVDQTEVGLPEDGILDEFRLYNRALSLAEIESSWQFGVIPTKPDYEITTAGGQVNIVDLSGNGETLTLSAPAAGQLLFAVPGRKFRVDGGPLRDDDSGPLDLSAITQISVSSEKGDDQINIGTFTALPSLTVSGGEGDDLVTFANNIRFAADASLDVDLRSDKDRCVIAGQLQLTGTGAASVRTNRDLVMSSGSSISVADGDISLEAHQQAVASTENFTALDLHGSLISTGAGKITLLGRAAAGAAAAHGVLLDGATINSTSTGSLSITGSVSGTPALPSNDIEIVGNSSITAPTQNLTGTLTHIGVSTITANTSLQITADQLTIDATASLSGAATTILNQTATRPIELGSADSATVLGLTDAELDRLSSTTLKIGNADTGAITQLAAVSRLGAVELRSGGKIALQTGTITAGSLLVDATSTITHTNTGVDADLSTGGPGTLRFGSADKLELNITDALTYDALVVLGAVDLTGLTLQLTGTHVPAEYGECFVLIDNDGTDPITGTFTGLAEGTIFQLNGRDMKITYLGGDGNDVIIYTKPDYLVTSTMGGGPLVITNPSGTDDALSFSQLPGGEISLAAAGRKFSVDNGPIRDGSSGAVSIATGVTSVVIDAGDGADVITIGAATDLAAMTINGGKGDDSVSFTGALSFKANSDLDVDLTNDDALPGVDRCTIGGLITMTGIGKAKFKVTRNILMTTGAGVSAVDGKITLDAHTVGAALAENFTAVEIRGSLSSSGTGGISVTGRGAPGALETKGVWLQDGSITGTGTGSVVMDGYIAGTSATRSIGLYVANSSITSSGPLQVKGTGGDGAALTAGETASVGILIELSSVIEATAGKQLLVSGQGGNVVGLGSSYGTILNGSTVKSLDSLTSLYGFGGDCANGTSGGLAITVASEVSCKGDTTSFVYGTAYNSASAPSGTIGSLGCLVTADSKVEGDAASGEIYMSGTSGDAATFSQGLVLEGSLTGGGAKLNLYGTSANALTPSAQDNGLSLLGSIAGVGSPVLLYGRTQGVSVGSSSVLVGSAATVTVASLKLDTNSIDVSGTATLTGTTCTLDHDPSPFPIEIGGSDSATALGLTGVELGRLDFDTVIINAESVTQTASAAAVGNLELHSQTTITLGQLTANGTLLLDATDYVTPAATGSMAAATRLNFAANNTLQINIANDGTYQALSVTGEVDVTNVGLDILGTYVPPPGYTILPVVNDGTDAIIGEFTGVPEDGEYPFNGEDFVITYLGGTGNDLEMFTYGDPVVTLGPITLNQDTGLYEQVLTLTNPQPKAMRGVRVTVLNIEQKIVLRNRSHPFLPIIESNVIIPARGSATLTVMFYNGGRNLGTWVPQYLVESLNRDLGPMPGDFSGLYHGLASRTAGINPITGSSLTLTLSKAGACTGSLTTEGKTLKFTGLISIDPLNPLKPRFVLSFPTIQRQLNLSFDPILQTVVGELASLVVPAPAAAPVLAWRQPWTLKAPANPAPGFKGIHNISLTHADSAVTVPQGAAFASLTVAKDDGVFVMAGRLPDGSAITGSSFIGAEGQARVFTPLYKNTGSVLGQLKVTLLRPTIPNPSIIPNPVTGTLDWSRPAALVRSKDRFYRPGVALKLTAEGGLYTPPAAGQLLRAVPSSIPGTPNSVLEFVDGGLDIHNRFAQLLRLYNPTTTGLTNKVQIAPRTPYAVSVLVFDSSKGLFSGRFTVPGAVGVPSRSGTYSGMLVPKTGYLLGTGYFLLPQLPVAPQNTGNSPMLSGKVHFWDNRVPPTP